MKFPPEWFDLKAAILGALMMGSVIGFINASHGPGAALSSALRQGVYTFFFAGLIMQHCRWLSARELSPWSAIAMATIWPTIITVVLVFTLHSVRGTPEPVLSTIPPGALGMLTYFIVSRQAVMGETRV